MEEEWHGRIHWNSLVYDKETYTGYWPLTCAVVQDKWELANPLRKFLMLNSHPLWEGIYFTIWTSSDAVGKEHMLQDFWDLLESEVKHKLSVYERGDFDDPCYAPHPLWAKRPPVWRKLFCVLPWSFLVKDLYCPEHGRHEQFQMPINPLCQKLKELEISALFLIDELASCIYETSVPGATGETFCSEAGVEFKTFPHNTWNVIENYLIDKGFHLSIEEKTQIVLFKRRPALLSEKRWFINYKLQEMLSYV